MITPEMPTGRAVRQAVVDDESDGKLNDSIRVIGFRWSNGGHIDVEMFFAFTTVVGGVPQQELNRSARVEIAEVTKFSLSDDVLSGWSRAKGTGRFFADAGAMLDFGFGQVFGTGKFFGGVGQIFSGTGHSKILLDFNIKKGSLPIFTMRVKDNLTGLMLHCLEIQGFDSVILSQSPNPKSLPMLPKMLFWVE